MCKFEIQNRVSFTHPNIYCWFINLKSSISSIASYHIIADTLWVLEKYCLGWGWILKAFMVGLLSLSCMLVAALTKSLWSGKKRSAWVNGFGKQGTSIQKFIFFLSMCAIIAHGRENTSIFPISACTIQPHNWRLLSWSLSADHWWWVARLDGAMPRHSRGHPLWHLLIAAILKYYGGWCPPLLQRTQQVALEISRSAKDDISHLLMVV